MSTFFTSKFGGWPKSKGSSASARPLFLCQPYCSNRIVQSHFKNIVQLPKYVDQNEWLAVNVFDFYVYVNMFYGSISDFCTDRDCPIMSAGPGFEYPLLDGQKKASKPTAPQYILVALSSIQDLINDENVFPTKDGNEFPATFRQNVKTIFKQLMRIFAHMYHSHFDKMLPLYQEGHLNSLFAHFVRFAREFDLLEKKDMLPMQELVDFFGNEGILN